MGTLDIRVVHTSPCLRADDVHEAARQLPTCCRLELTCLSPPEHLLFHFARTHSGAKARADIRAISESWLVVARSASLRLRTQRCKASAA